eukprot:3351708-Prymnesium_polylepis.1
MMLIANSPPPTLEPTTPASAPFHALLAAALTKDAATRPTAAALLAHPFAQHATAQGLQAAIGGLTSAGRPRAESRERAESAGSLDRTMVL